MNLSFEIDQQPSRATLYTSPIISHSDIDIITKENIKYNIEWIMKMNNFVIN